MLNAAAADEGKRLQKLTQLSASAGPAALQQSLKAISLQVLQLTFLCTSWLKVLMC